MSGLGQSSQTGNTSSTSQTQPWAPAIPALEGALGPISTIQGQLNNISAPSMWSQAQKTAAGLPNPGTAAAGVGQNLLSSGGDPTGILAQMQQSMGNINNPAASPGMQGLLNTINTDVSNNVNSQFAGAGRSLSGMNEQTLARGLAQGMAAPLQAQYNSNLGTLGGIASARTGNTQAGLQDLSQALPLSQLPAQTQQAAINAPTTNLAQMAGLPENLSIPIAGLGGQTSGTGNFSGTSNASLGTILAQLMGGSGGGILGGGLGLAGTVGLL